MVSKHISIWIKHLTVRIGRLDIRNAKMSYKHMWAYAYGSRIANLSLSLYIYIYEEGSSYNNFWVTTSYNKHFLNFQSPNRRSKPLDVISTIKCAWRPNFTFFGIVLLFIKMVQKLVKFRPLNFVPILINGKKIPKNVKFGLQAHFIIEITSNNLDRRFGLWKCRKWLW